jgi:HD-GYP domain-containing protein (c-di-GMP phosphodiesterase class II)
MLAAESALGYGGQILSNIHIVRHLQQVAVQTVCALVNAIDAKDNYTFGHSHRVAWLARLTGTALGLAKGELQSLEWAGLLHDVGKIGVSERILNKPGPLTPEEFEEVKRHPRIGYEVLRPVERFGAVLDAVLYHHENHDGSGYPEGRRGEEIPLSARIIHVVDIFDALTTTRTYRDRFPLDDAIAVLDRDAGRVTDPIVTTAFVAAIRRHMVENAGDFAQRFAHIARRAPGEKNGEVAATNGPKTTLGGANA